MLSGWLEGGGGDTAQLVGWISAASNFDSEGGGRGPKVALGGVSGVMERRLVSCLNRKSSTLR
jgi:hypothetical protein